MKNSSNSRKGGMNLGALSDYRNAVYGAAAIWITLFHGVILGKVEFPPSLRLIEGGLEIGNIGVDIFVLLSGVGLYFSAVKKPRLGEFYYKRGVRILLPYLILAVPYIFYYAVIVLGRWGLFALTAATLNTWLGINDVIDLWYVPAILFFYLIHPLIHKVIFRREQGAALRTAALAALSIALTMALFRYFEDIYRMYDKILPRLTVFIIGCYLGKLVKEKRRVPVGVLIIAAAVVIGAYPLYARTLLAGAWRRYYGSLTGIALTLILSQAFVLLEKIKLDRICGFFGKFSLEIYIATVVARQIYMRSGFYDGNVWEKYLIIALGAIIAAYLVSLVEIPLRKWLLKT